MLLFLDGAKNTTQAPNENFGRELLELYTLGIGNYTETDVRSAAVALTGWTLKPRDAYTAVFDPRRHTAAPQMLLGRKVSDVNSVVDAAVDQPACAQFIAGKLADWLLGPGVDDALIESFAGTFRSSGMQLRPLVRAILQAGLDGKGAELVLAPVPWLVGTQRALGTRLDTRAALRWLASAGQVPLNPPNVGGWPGASAWLGASATVARLSTAAALVDALPATSPALQAAAAGDVDRLARALGLPGGFSAPTRDALSNTSGASSTRPGAAALAVALASPDLLVA